MSPWYATNARQLLAMREEHMLAPAGPVVVSLVGGDFADVADMTLHVRPEMPVDRMDWHMLVNLRVWLWASPRAQLEWLLATAVRVARAQPKELVLRFEDGQTIHDVDIGIGMHTPAVLDLPALHAFWWCPTNCSGTFIADRLRRALNHAVKPGACL